MKKLSLCFLLLGLVGCSAIEFEKNQGQCCKSSKQCEMKSKSCCKKKDCGKQCDLKKS